MKSVSTLLVLVVGLFVATSGNALETGFLDRIVRVNGNDYRYQVYVPRAYALGKKPMPIVLALHGGGEYGRDGLSQTETGLASAIRRHAERFPTLVVFPQSPPGGTPGFQGLGARIALQALDNSMAEFNVDASRVYLTGMSMGGNGAWYLAYHNPRRFAAMVVVCGFIQSMRFDVEYPPIAPTDSENPYAVVARKIGHMPVWLFHGDADPTVPVNESRHMVVALRGEGADVRYTELSGVGHDAWDQAYNDATVIEWLLAQRR